MTIYFFEIAGETKLNGFWSGYFWQNSITGPLGGADITKVRGLWRGEFHEIVLPVATIGELRDLLLKLEVPAEEVPAEEPEVPTEEPTVEVEEVKEPAAPKVTLTDKETERALTTFTFPEYNDMRKEMADADFDIRTVVGNKRDTDSVKKAYAIFKLRPANDD